MIHDTLSPATEAPHRRRLPESPVRKPNWDAWTTGRSIGLVILLLPVLAVLGFAAQVVELVYYAVMCVYYVAMSPYWTVRTVWRAVRPVSTPLHAERRAEARQIIRGTLKAVGCLLIVLLILGAALVGFVLAIEMAGN